MPERGIDPAYPYFGPIADLTSQPFERIGSVLVGGVSYFFFRRVHSGSSPRDSVWMMAVDANGIRSDWITIGTATADSWSFAVGGDYDVLLIGNYEDPDVGDPDDNLTLIHIQLRPWEGPGGYGILAQCDLPNVNWPDGTFYPLYGAPLDDTTDWYGDACLIAGSKWMLARLVTTSLTDFHSASSRNSIQFVRVDVATGDAYGLGESSITPSLTQRISGASFCQYNRAQGQGALVYNIYEDEDATFRWLSAYVKADPDDLAAAPTILDGGQVGTTESYDPDFYTIAAWGSFKPSRSGEAHRPHCTWLRDNMSVHYLPPGRDVEPGGALLPLGRFDEPWTSPMKAFPDGTSGVGLFSPDLMVRIDDYAAWATWRTSSFVMQLVGRIDLENPDVPIAFFTDTYSANLDPHNYEASGHIYPAGRRVVDRDYGFPGGTTYMAPSMDARTGWGWGQWYPDASGHLSYLGLIRIAALPSVVKRRPGVRVFQRDDRAPRVVTVSRSPTSRDSSMRVLGRTYD